MRSHAAWVEHIRKAREEGLSGPPRLERRDGQLCIVGMGRCEPVSSAFEGARRIEDIQNQVAALFPTTQTLVNVPPRSSSPCSPTLTAH